MSLASSGALIRSRCCQISRLVRRTHGRTGCRRAPQATIPCSDTPMPPVLRRRVRRVADIGRRCPPPFRTVRGPGRPAPDPRPHAPKTRLACVTPCGTGVAGVGRAISSISPMAEHVAGRAARGLRRAGDRRWPRAAPHRRSRRAARRVADRRRRAWSSMSSRALVDDARAPPPGSASRRRPLRARLRIPDNAPAHPPGTAPEPGRALRRGVHRAGGRAPLPAGERRRCPSSPGACGGARAVRSTWYFYAARSARSSRAGPRTRATRPSSPWARRSSSSRRTGVPRDVIDAVLAHGATPTLEPPRPRSRLYWIA